MNSTRVNHIGSKNYRIVYSTSLLPNKITCYEMKEKKNTSHNRDL